METYLVERQFSIIESQVVHKFNIHLPEAFWFFLKEYRSLIENGKIETNEQQFKDVLANELKENLAQVVSENIEELALQISDFLVKQLSKEDNLKSKATQKQQVKNNLKQKTLSDILQTSRGSSSMLYQYINNSKFINKTPQNVVNLGENLKKQNQKKKSEKVIAKQRVTTPQRSSRQKSAQNKSVSNVKQEATDKQLEDLNKKLD